MLQAEAWGEAVYSLVLLRHAEVLYVGRLPVSVISRLRRYGQNRYASTNPTIHEDREDNAVLSLAAARTIRFVYSV